MESSQRNSEVGRLVAVSIQYLLDDGDVIVVGGGGVVDGVVVGVVVVVLVVVVDVKVLETRARGAGGFSPPLHPWFTWHSTKMKNIQV